MGRWHRGPYIPDELDEDGSHCPVCRQASDELQPGATHLLQEGPRCGSGDKCEEEHMKIEAGQPDWAFIQKSHSSYGPIAEQVDCFAFIESANASFNRLVERFAEHEKIVPALVGPPRIAWLNQLGRYLYRSPRSPKVMLTNFPERHMPQTRSSPTS
jgi:hypothetical protein